MIISSLELTNFRNYSKKSFEFDPRITIITGPNGSGKTNIIEAIYLLATGGSWRAGSSDEMIKFEKEVAHINCYIAKLLNCSPSGNNATIQQCSNLQITLTRGSVQGKPTSKILYKINSVPRRRSDFVGQLKAVLFEPESLEIIIGDPGRRRAFLDENLFQTDPEYTRSFLIYQKSLRTRNRLLDFIREKRSNIESLEYWERALVKHGTYIQDKRRELIDWINENIVTLLHGYIAKNTAMKQFSNETILELDYFPNIISPDRLNQYRDREILTGHTFTGPQRDEVNILMAKWPDGQMVNHSGLQPFNHFVSAFGSRGEQRMAVLQLKLLEVRWIEEKTGESPVILLDDIFSELDEKHEKMVGELIKGKQAVITATEYHPQYFPEKKIVELQVP